MDNPSLSKKRKIKTPDGDMLDLSLTTVDIDMMSQVENMHFVTSDEEMRLDNIANKYYGWADKLDAILWANGIFNPFSIEEGDWLIIPRVKDSDLYAVNPKVSKMPDEENTQSTSSKISTAADKLNSSAKKAKKEREKKKEMRRPNEQTPGKSHKQVNGAVLLLG